MAKIPSLLKQQKSQILLVMVIVMAVTLTLSLLVLQQARTFGTFYRLQLDTTKAFSVAKSGLGIAQSFITKSPLSFTEDSTYNFTLGEGNMKIEIANPTLTPYGQDEVFTADITSTGTAGKSIRVLKTAFRTLIPPPASIYRSVGINPADLNINNRTVTISDTTATFSGPMPDDVGVGDVLKYNSGGTQVAFISGRSSSTVYTLQAADGGTPVAAGAGTAVDVYRAYTSLYYAERGAENGSIGVNFDTWVDGKDIVVSKEQWNIACYADGEDTTGVFINGWTTGEYNYVRIFTPVDPSEVGVSQRHEGIADTGYRLRPVSEEDGIVIEDDYVRIEGLEICWFVEDGILAELISANSDIRISYCLIHDNTPLAHGNGIKTNDPDLVIRIWNNIVYNCENDGIDIAEAKEAYVYNNTLFNILDGTAIWGSADYYCRAKNNLIANSSADNYNGNFHGDSDYNWSDDDTDTGGDHDINSGDAEWSDVIFVDEANDDFHLAATDTGAQDLGADLSGDPNLQFTDDIDGDSRPYGTDWDIGADEYQPDIFSGLVGHWKFDEGNGPTAYDSSGRGNHGTLENGPSWGTGDCISNSCLEFDGSNDRVNVGSDSSLDDLGPMTISAWIYPRSKGEGTGGMITAKPDDNSGPGRWHFQVADWETIWFEKDYPFGEGDLWVRSQLWQWIDYNIYQHVVLTWTGSRFASAAKIYVDGNEVTTWLVYNNGQGTPQSDASYDLFIGNDVNFGNTFDGFIDEVRIYNRVLNDSEIDALFHEFD